MMISPSENAGGRDGAVGQPVRLLGLGGRGVSRLEFHPLDTAEVISEVEVRRADGAENQLTVEVAELDDRLRLQVERMEEEIARARSEARAEGRSEWEKELEVRIAEERSAIVKMGDEFRRERSKYFAGVEAEVVKLALAIAARVLHREVKMDPLLLAGVVRVALEKVADESATVLRVPTNAGEMWRESFAASPESLLQVVGDDRLAVGECVLETNVGRVELGVRAQLEEIERGFFDLMQQRPA
jgi:flagellar assembly protein FliH